MITIAQVMEAERLSEMQRQALARSPDRLCEDCPPAAMGDVHTRCVPCPRRSKPWGAHISKQESPT